MREIKTVKCTGDILKGDIFETANEKDYRFIQFRIKTIRGLSSNGGTEEKKVRVRLSKEDLTELRDEIDAVLERMEEEFK